MYVHKIIYAYVYDHISIINNSENTLYIRIYTNLSLFIHKGLKVIVGLLAIIVLYFLVSEIVPVFTKSNETGGEFNEWLLNIMCIQLMN